MRVPLKKCSSIPNFLFGPSNSVTDCFLCYSTMHAFPSFSHTKILSRNSKFLSHHLLSGKCCSELHTTEILINGMEIHIFYFSTSVHSMRTVFSAIQCIINLFIQSIGERVMRKANRAFLPESVRRGGVLDGLWDEQADKYKCCCRSLHVTRAALYIAYAQMIITFIFALFFTYYYIQVFL